MILDMHSVSEAALHLLHASAAFLDLTFPVALAFIELMPCFSRTSAWYDLELKISSCEYATAGMLSTAEVMNDTVIFKFISNFYILF